MHAYFINVLNKGKCSASVGLLAMTHDDAIRHTAVALSSELDVALLL
jgi:hypothetical protein